jgi:O-antigen/teichoic acid export membrane protein
MSLIKSFSTYILSTIIEKGIGFFLVPMIAFKLSTSDVGSLYLFITILAFTTPLIMLSTSASLMVNFNRLDTMKQRADYTSSALSINIMLFLFFFLLDLLGLNYWSKLTGIRPLIIVCIPIIAFLDSIRAMALGYFQIIQKPWTYGLITILYTSISFLLSILFIYIFSFNYEGRIWGLLCGGLIISGISLYLFIKKDIVYLKVNRRYLKDSFFYGISLLPHAIGFLFLDIVDRFFIVAFVGKEALGIYSITYLFGSLVYIFAGVFCNAWVPILYDALKKNDKESLTKVVTTASLYAFGLLILNFLYCLIAPYIFRTMLKPEYMDGLSYFYWIVAGYFCLGLYLVFSAILFYEKKNAYFIISAGLNIILNTLLNYILVQRLGAYGSALATFISMFCFFLLVAYLSNKTKPLPWKYARVGVMGIFKNTF